MNPMTDESDDLIQIITTKTPPPTPTRSLYDATYSIGVAQYNYTWGIGGKGVGVWIDEAEGLPDSNNPYYNLNQITYQTPWLPANVHATQVALSYFAAAPESRIYASKTYAPGIWGEKWRMWHSLGYSISGEPSCLHCQFILGGPVLLRSPIPLPKL